MAPKKLKRDYSDNAVKYFLYHFKTGAEVCFHVLRWLYQGKSPIECFVGALAYAKKIILRGDEENVVDELENGTIEICNLNLTLLYKITQSICEPLRHGEEHKHLWGNKCPSNQKAELEHLLFLLNAGQNSGKKITKSDFEQILQKAGERGNVDPKQIKDAISKMHHDIRVTFNDKIDNSKNYNECGSYVINTILPWLYKEDLIPMKDLVIDLMKMKSIQIDDTQKDVLNKLRNKNIELSDLDISLLFKIIQSVCGLADNDKDKIFWNKLCPVDKQDELEYLLFKLKVGRNNVSHRYSEFEKNMTDSALKKKSRKMKSLLKSIIEKAGLKANIYVRDTITLIQNDIDRIRKNGKIDAYMRRRILKQIVNDLKFSYEDELKASFENELKGYSPPDLRSNNEDSNHLSDLLKFEESRIIVVEGEAGEGKTSLTKFLFNSWLSGNKDIMEELFLFEVVLRVNCNQMSCSDILKYYEDEFRIASSNFPEKVSLKKSLADFKVLWIMDGFDECTKEFKLFLENMTKSMPEKHKLLITTRPHRCEDLKEYLSKQSFGSFTLELLNDHNVMKIAESLIIGIEKVKQFKADFYSRDETAKQFLRNPLNLNLYIALWIQDPDKVRDTTTTKMLYINTINHNLSLLPKRLDMHSDLSIDELKDSLQYWFVNSLCKQSFLMLHRDHFNISKKVLDTLKQDALKFTQNTSMCLSTFLVTRKNVNWEDNGNSRYEFHHLIQQFILASLFMKHFKDYDTLLKGSNILVYI